MSVDVPFQPKAPTVNIDNSAAGQAISPGSPLWNSMVTFRIVNVASTPAAQRLGWGDTAAKTSAAALAGLGVANAANSILVPQAAVIYLELPAQIFFKAGAAGGFEITAGQGGVGG